MAINQENPKKEGQVEYRGRWVDRIHFRAFVYNQTGEKLAENYHDYQKLISSGLWFNSKELVIAEKERIDALDREKEKIDQANEESVQIAEENLSNVTKLERKPSKPIKLR